MQLFLAQRVILASLNILGRVSHLWRGNLGQRAVRTLIFGSILGKKRRRVLLHMHVLVQLNESLVVAWLLMVAAMMAVMLLVLGLRE